MHPTPSSFSSLICWKLVLNQNPRHHMGHPIKSCSFVLHLQDSKLPLEAHKLGSSSMICELACANFLSAFWRWSLSVETLFSAILTSSVRLSWRLLYHSTFLSDSEDALSSMWWTMFSHAIWKAFSTSLDSISTVGAYDASTTCKAYASHVSHPSQCVVVMKWGIPWMSHVLDFSPTSNISATPCSGTLISLVSISGSIF